MLLFRGQNTDSPFEPTKSRMAHLGGDNGAVFFMGYERRNSAVSYALTNYKIFEEDAFFDEENEWVDEGVFYQCKFNIQKPKMLNDIEANSLVSSLPEVYKMLNDVDDILFENQEDFIDFAHRSGSALKLIEEINDIRHDYTMTKKNFDELIEPILNECGTSIAIAVENGEKLDNEFLVYRTSDVSVMKKIPVYKSDLQRQSLKERLRMSIKEVTERDQKHIDDAILSR